MNATVDVSVVVVNWRTPALTVSALSSVLEAAGADGLEIQIVVVDNGSEDNSVSLISDAFPQAKVISSHTNEGYARAVNKALPECRAEAILLLNSDATVKPGTLPALLQVLEDHPRAAAVGARLLRPDGTEPSSAAPYPCVSSELLPRFLRREDGRTRFPIRTRHAPNQPFQVQSLIGAAMMVRRTAVLDVGPLDERFFLFYEETDWCFRAYQKGWEVLLVPAAEVTHQQGGSSKQAHADVRLEFFRSRYRYVRKHGSKSLVVSIYAICLTKLVVDTVLAGIALVLTAGRYARARNRWRTLSYILRWHLHRCPNEWGFQPPENSD